MTEPIQTPEATPTPAAAEPAKAEDKPLGPAGQSALAAERERAETERRRANDLQAKVAELEPLKALQPLALALGGKAEGNSKTDLEMLTERLAEHEKSLTEERSARFRAEVAHEKGFTPEQASMLTGTTREEMTAAADRLLALFPTTPVKPGTLAPDPSQGARGGTGIDLDARIAEAQKAGDYRTVISLQNQKLNK